MATQQPSGEFDDRLNDQTRRAWDAVADWWDERIGDGNDFQRELIDPATDRLLDVRPGQVLLDVACGAGRFARRLARRGAQVVAIDFCEAFLARARSRTPADVTGIEYRLVDATRTDDLLALGRARFDGAVCTMALMDMAAVEPLFAGLAGLLKPDGWFVFSLLHPCFKSNDVRKFAETAERDGRFQIDAGVKVTDYLTPKAWKGVGVAGQPEAHWYFHRPMHVLFNTGFRHGFVIDGFEEPNFAPRPASATSLTAADLPEIPPVLVVRMRLKPQPRQRA